MLGDMQSIRSQFYVIVCVFAVSFLN